MNCLDNVERISVRELEPFRRNYIFAPRPAIVTNLFEDQPIRGITSAAAAEQALGDVRIEIREEISSYVLKHRAIPDPKAKEFCSLREYFEHIRRDPATRKMCSENLTPSAVAALFRLPDYRGINASESLADAASMLFVANRGNHAHLHFDGDYRQVLLYQVFGAKRVIMIRPEQAAKLNAVRNFSACFLEYCSEEDKLAFVRNAGGYDCIVHPGQAVFIPACWWHYVEYLETGMSFNMRFGRNRFTRFLGERLHKDIYAQNIAALMVDETAVTGQLLDAYHAILAAYREPADDRYRKGIYMQSVLRQVCERIQPQAVARSCVFDNLDPVRDWALRWDSETLFYDALPDPAELLLGWRAGAH